MDFALFEAVKGFNYLSGDKKLDDDFADRINRYWSALMMILFAVILSARQIVGDPLKCWTPQEFKDPWIEYAEDYCWVKNTYFVPKSKDLPPKGQPREDQELLYYQWIPYVMALQAFMYYLPAMIWRLLNWKSGLDLTTIVSRAANNEKLDGVALQLGKNMRLRSKYEKTESFLDKNFLTCLYLFVKLLYALNAVGQFFLLSSFFGRATDALFTVTRDLAAGNEWHETGHFPRVSFCDFTIRLMGGHINSYTVQCVLTINIFTEKIFVFAGFWMLFVAVLTITNAFGWFTGLLLPWRRRGFVRDLLPEVTRRDRYNFLEKCVGTDGLLVFHLIAANSDEATAAKLMRMVYDAYSVERSQSDYADSPQGSGFSDSPIPLLPMPNDEKKDMDKDEDEAATLPLRSRGVDV